MSTQLRGKKREGAAIDKNLPSSTKITMTDASEDTSPIEIAMPEPDGPTNAVLGTQINKEGHWSFQQKQRYGRRRLMRPEWQWEERQTIWQKAKDGQKRGLQREDGWILHKSRGRQGRTVTSMMTTHS